MNRYYFKLKKYSIKNILKKFITRGPNFPLKDLNVISDSATTLPPTGYNTIKSLDFLIN